MIHEAPFIGDSPPPPPPPTFPYYSSSSYISCPPPLPPPCHPPPFPPQLRVKGIPQWKTMQQVGALFRPMGEVLDVRKTISGFFVVRWCLLSCTCIHYSTLIIILLYILE